MRTSTWLLASLFCLALALPSPGVAQMLIPTKKLSGLINTELGSNFYPWGSVDHSAYLSVFGMISYRPEESWNLALQLPALQSLTEPVTFTLFDLALVAQRRPIALGPRVNLMPNIGLIFPVSERSRARESLQWGARTGIRILSNFSAIPKWSWLTLSYDFSATKAFHEFKTATTGAVNQEYRLSQRLGLWAQAGEKWSFSIDALRFSNLSYQRNWRNSFSLTETVSYFATEGLTVSAGITNEGDVLRANGIDSNVAIFDPTASRAFLSLSLML